MKKRVFKKPLPSPKGSVEPARYRMDDERYGITKRVEIYTERINEDGEIIKDDRGFLKIFKVKLYFTVNVYEDGTPGEIFIDVSKEGHDLHGWADSWAAAVSILLQHGVHPKIMIKKFKYAEFIPCGHTSLPEVPTCSSIPDLIMKYLEYKFFSDKEDDDGYSAIIESAVAMPIKQEKV